MRPDKQSPQSVPTRGLKPGDWVEVKSWDEIKRTLDGSGMLESLPFMPEMLPFCEQRLRVEKRADRTCDGDIRRMNDAVHLEGLRCNGSSHGGCQARCTFIWKEAWLKKLPAGQHSDRVAVAGAQLAVAWAPELVTLRPASGSTKPVYVCQTTQLRAATTPLPTWDLPQLWQDVRCGNIRVNELKLFLNWSWQYLFWFAFKRKQKSASVKIKRTPTQYLDLHPGDRVRVKSRAEIFETLDYLGKNRGLAFSAEMLKHCGKEFTVTARVDRMLNPATGEMIEMKNPCVILESVICAGQCMFCPRGLYHYWREIWLERVTSTVQAPSTSSNACSLQPHSSSLSRGA